MNKIEVHSTSFSRRAVSALLGSFLLILFIPLFILGVRETNGFNHLYIYWSFTYVNPFSNFPPGFYPGFPEVVKTYEVLMPLIVIAISSVVSGLVTLIIGLTKYRI
jgi:Ca2+/Na+ antiporter